jgi:hypothetical protein
MRKMTVGQVLSGLLLLILIALASYWLVFRPRSHRWGATDAEVVRSLPGDALVPTVKVHFTQAITIDAPAEDVWPWVVQLGWQRAGWYTYDWFYRLTGSADFFDGKTSADRIIPELQGLKVGDSISLFDQMDFAVVGIEPSRALVLLARVDLDSSKTFKLSDNMPANYINMSWVYYLEEIDAHSTRLIVRWLGDYSPGFANSLSLGIPTDAGALIMQPKMLKGIKARTESQG